MTGVQTCALPILNMVDEKVDAKIAEVVIFVNTVDEEVDAKIAEVRSKSVV